MCDCKNNCGCKEKLVEIKANNKKGVDFVVDLSVSQAFVSHKSAPKGYPKEKIEYADPKNFKYPINSEERVRAAWSYINQSKNQKGYTSGEIASIKSRIKRAGHKYGIKFDE